MIRLLAIAMIALITGCSGGSGGSSEAAVPPTPVVAQSVSRPLTSMWYGDSRCVDNDMIGNRNCIAGISLMDIEEIDADYDVVVIHLGFNDMIGDEWLEWWTIYEFRDHLNNIAGGKYNVWCILPSWANGYATTETVSLYREAMIDVCSNTVDPQIEGYQEDGIHYTDYNYEQIGEVYSEIMLAANKEQSK